MTEFPVVVKHLESGFWHVKWNDEVWAQWPDHRDATSADFFHDTGTPERVRMCSEARAAGKETS